MGWTDEHGNEAISSRGKGMRGALVILGSEAVGGTAEQALPGGVAVELIHNFSLIHDDIMDGDRVRRHRRTVWDVYGIGDAIIVGDALHVLAFEVLITPNSTPQMIAASRRLASATAAMIAGQAQDVALDRAPRATLDQCLAMEANKTGALLAQSIAIGAELGGGATEAILALEQYGMALGRAFQAVDDALGIWGDPDVTGKPAGNDLRERKKSVPIALALDRGGSLEADVLAAYASQPDADTINALAERLESEGIRDEVAQVAKLELDDALGYLDSPGLNAATVNELRELASFVADRNS